ncbi:MAG: Prolipoprotein diacylglyceryl transferase [Bacteroidia bacterium]|nr:Prolipoprotein diacylglyceryl transferase [Bacteroidia bacterium]
MFLAYIHWNIAPEAFTVFGIPVRYYGLLFVGGFIAAFQFLEWLYKREKIPYQQLSRLATYAIIGSFAGARLGHCLFYEPDYFLYHPLEMLLPIGYDENGKMVFQAYTGLASHGGAFGILLAMLVYKWKTKEDLLPLLDRILIATPLACGFIRMANFFNSEIIGYPTDVPWAIVFEQVDMQPRHPAQLYEAVFYFSLFVVMFLLYRKNGLSTSTVIPSQAGSVVEGPTQKIKTGFYFAWCIIALFTFRFFVEFIKERQVGFEENLPIDMGQILSIPFVVLGIWILVKKELSK